MIEWHDNYAKAFCTRSNAVDEKHAFQADRLQLNSNDCDGLEITNKSIDFAMRKEI